MTFKCSICGHRSQSIGAAGKHMRKAHPQIYRRRQEEGRAKAKAKAKKESERALFHPDHEEIQGQTSLARLEELVKEMEHVVRLLGK